MHAYIYIRADKQNITDLNAYGSDTIKGRKQRRGKKGDRKRPWEGECVYEGEGEGGINLPIGDADNDNDKINYQNYKNYQTVYYFKMKYLQN